MKESCRLRKNLCLRVVVVVVMLRNCSRSYNVCEVAYLGTQFNVLEVVGKVFTHNYSLPFSNFLYFILNLNKLLVKKKCVRQNRLLSKYLLIISYYTVC